MEKNVTKILTPYYINQSRLLDIYSILNRGYSEYEEVTNSNSFEKRTKGKVGIEGSGGFKLIKISAAAEGELEHDKENSSLSKIKKVQTISSILSYVREEMMAKKYFKDISEALEGDFIEVPVRFCLNSIKQLLELFKDIIDLNTVMQSFNSSGKQFPYTRKQIESLEKGFKFLFGGLEVFYEVDDFALVGNILENNIYLSDISDLVQTNLICICQVKKIFPNGTNLLKNTLFSKIKDSSTKNSFIDLLAEFGENEDIDLGVTSKAEIAGKKVFDVEILSLCR